MKSFTVPAPLQPRRNSIGQRLGVFWLHQHWSRITVETFTASGISNAYVPLSKLTNGETDKALEILKRQMETSLKDYRILRNEGLLVHESFEELIQKAESLQKELETNSEQLSEPYK